MADDARVREVVGAGFGSLGPVNMPLLTLVDRSAALVSDFCAGANEEEHHFFNINWGRDLPEPDVRDLREVVAGDPSPDGHGTLEITRGIEVGHIFQLGTKYSEAMNCNMLDKNGKQYPCIWGATGSVSRELWRRRSNKTTTIVAFCGHQHRALSGVHRSDRRQKRPRSH